MDDECNTCGGTGRWMTTLEEAPTELLDIGPCPEGCSQPTPDDLMQWFSDLVNGTDNHGDLSAADVVHMIVEDVLDSVRLAITEGPIVCTDEEADEVVGTVLDYYGNHYGEL